MKTETSVFFDDLDTFFQARRLRRRGATCAHRDCERAVAEPQLTCSLHGGETAQFVGEWLEDSFDYGVQWRDLEGRQYRLTWIGPVHRDEGDGGELYLVRLVGGGVTPFAGGVMIYGGDDKGLVEWLCNIPPAPEISTAGCPNGCGTLVWVEPAQFWRCPVCGDSFPEEYVASYPPTGFGSVSDRNAEIILDGWADACGPKGSVDWIRETVARAIADGKAVAPGDAP